MPLYKKGTCSSPVIISSSIYSCSSCGHTEIVQDDNTAQKECPKCKSMMKMISAHISALSNT